MIKYLKDSFRFLMYSNLFTGLCACSLAISTFYFFHLPINSHVFEFVATGLFIALGYQFPYLLNKDWFTNNTRLVWYSHNNRRMKVLFCIEIIIFSFILFQINSFQVLLFVHLAIIGWCYYQGFSFPNKSNTTYTLRNLPHAKTLSIGYVWAVVTVLIPLGQHLSWLQWEDVLLLTIMRIALVCALCLIFDLRDKEQDDDSNLPTLPVKYGLSATYAAIFSLLSFYLLTLILNFGLTYFSLCFSFIAFWIFLLLKWQRNRKDDFFYLIMVDGTMILPVVVCVLWHWKC